MSKTKIIYLLHVMVPSRVGKDFVVGGVSNTTTVHDAISTIEMADSKASNLGFKGVNVLNI